MEKLRQDMDTLEKEEKLHYFSRRQTTNYEGGRELGLVSKMKSIFK